MSEIASEQDTYDKLKSLMKSMGMLGLHRLEVGTVGSPPHRGMKLLEDVPAHTSILSVPFEGLLQAQGPLVMSELGDILTCDPIEEQQVNPFLHSNGEQKGQPFPQRMLALYVLHESRKGKQSQWYDYMQTLPKQFSLLEDFSEEEMDQLRGTALHTAVMEKMHSRRTEWEIVRLFVPMCRPDYPPITWEDWHWARNIVNTRAFSYEMVDPKKDQYEWALERLTGNSSTPVKTDICLVPYVELANHANVNVSWFTFNGAVHVYSNDALRAGDEFFISYGDHLDNQHLAEYYGFVVEGNSNQVPSDCKLHDCACLLAHAAVFNTTIAEDQMQLRNQTLSFNMRNAIRLRLEQRLALQVTVKRSNCL